MSVAPVHAAVLHGSATALPSTTGDLDFAGFRNRNSAEGLFRRYARGRVRGFLLRQTLTLAGSLLLWLTGSWQLAALAAGLALLGDTLDCAVLLRGEKQIDQAQVAAKWSAAVQALTISGCIALCWLLVPQAEMRFFAATFLMSAAINAGLVRHHFPSGNALRLGIYATTAILMVLDLLTAGPWTNSTQLVFATTVILLAYVAALFIRAIEKGRAERLRFETALFAERAALEASQLRLAETARQAERLALVARHANDSVIFTSPDGRIEWVNEGFTKITGYAFDEAVGRKAQDLLHSQGKSGQGLDELYAAQAAGRPCRVELQNCTKAGKLIWMEVSMAPILRPDGSPEVFIAVERDVTEARAHATQLAEARESALAAARAKSAFLATISHEIRTPLNGVLGVADLLADTRLGPEQRRYLHIIRESGQALLTILNDVLDLSKLQSGKFALLSQPFPVAGCIEGVIDLLGPAAAKKGLRLQFERPANAISHLGDPGRLRQILLNLMGNALKFTETGGVAVSLGIQPDGEADLVEIAVTDSGIGIPADQLGQVFDSFTQADPTIASRYGGTGLGLSISRLLTKQMGGDITATSSEGQGSVFTLSIRLPKAFALQGDVQTLAAPRTSLHLLLAEDNRTNLMIASKILGPCVGRISVARNGREAVAAFLADPPDLVLMDVSMPEIDGHEATRIIRRHEAATGAPPCPIFALTAFSSEEEEILCHKAGLDAVLTKPLTRETLYALLIRIDRQRNHQPPFDLYPSDRLDRKKPATG